MTSQPAANSASHRWLPTNPAPPVTSARAPATLLAAIFMFSVSLMSERCCVVESRRLEQAIGSAYREHGERDRASGKAADCPAGPEQQRQCDCCHESDDDPAGGRPRGSL